MAVSSSELLNHEQNFDAIDDILLSLTNQDDELHEENESDDDDDMPDFGLVSEHQFKNRDSLLWSYNTSFSPLKKIYTLENYSVYENYPMNNPQKLLICLEKALKGGDYMKDRLLSTLRANFFQLMTDENMQYVFEKFLDLCEEDEMGLSSLVLELWWRPDLFIDAAFCRQGVISILKLMKKLKKRDDALTVTKILSTRFVEMMTHYIAKDVILQCENLFDLATTSILYICKGNNPFTRIGHTSSGIHITDAND